MRGPRPTHTGITNVLAPEKYIQFAGHLYKKRTGQIRTGWVERFFVLTDESLHYFRQPKVVRRIGVFGEERAIVALSDIRTIDYAAREADGKRVVVLTTSAATHPTVHLWHAEASVVDAWKEALVAACGAVKRGVSSGGGSLSSGGEGDPAESSCGGSEGVPFLPSSAGVRAKTAVTTPESAPKKSILLRHHKRAKHALGALLLGADIGGAFHALLDANADGNAGQGTTSFFPVPLSTSSQTLIARRASTRTAPPPVGGTGICAMGYLMKRGPVIGQQTLRGSRGLLGGGTRWTHRFFVLTPCALIYFRRDHPQDELFGERRSVLDFEDIAAIAMGKTWVRSAHRGAGRHARSDSSDVTPLGGGRDRVDSTGDSSAAAPSPRSSGRAGPESEAEDAIVITMDSGARYELRSKHAAPSTLGKNVLAAWLSVLLRQFETMQPLRSSTLAPTLDMGVVAVGNAPPPGASSSSHARKASWANILLDGIGAAATSVVSPSPPPLLLSPSGGASGGASSGEASTTVAPHQLYFKVSFLLFTVTFYANLAHSLTRSP